MWAMKGKKRERGRERKNEIRFYSSRKYKLPRHVHVYIVYVVLLGIRIVLRNNSANE